MAESTQSNMFGIKDYEPDKTLRNVKVPLAYEVRKIQMAIRAIDKEMYKNPSKINIKDYVSLLETHTEKIAALKKTGYFEKKGQDDTETMDEEVSLGEGEAGISEEISVGVDLGVSAEDTFAT